MTEHSGDFIHDHSDDVLNPGGAYIGSAEVYRQAEMLDEIIDSISIGEYREGDVRVALFDVLRPGVVLDYDLRKRIRHKIGSGATLRHVPIWMMAVADIPRTLSGKIVELAL